MVELGFSKQSPICGWSFLRKTFNINNTCDLIMGNDGSDVWLTSKAKNQFFHNREMQLGFGIAWYYLQICFCCYSTPIKTGQKASQEMWPTINELSPFFLAVHVHHYQPAVESYRSLCFGPVVKHWFLPLTGNDCSRFGFGAGEWRDADAPCLVLVVHPLGMQYFEMDQGIIVY